jgi:hypothetical protein
MKLLYGTPGRRGKGKEKDSQQYQNTSVQVQDIRICIESC